jgi:predicted flap endonuclease-1-like 5' DNA nuclease
LSDRLAALEPLAGRLGERDASLKAFQSDYQSKFRNLTEEISKLGGRLADLQPLSAQILDRDAKSLAFESDYQSKFLHTNEAVSTLRNRLAELESLSSQAESSSARFEALASRLEATLRQTAEQVADLEKRLPDLNPLSARIEENERRLRALESVKVEPRPENVSGAEMQQVRTPKQGRARVRARRRDDLKQIHGIGPVIERILYRQGVFLYRQIAGWKNEDIERISQKLGTFQDRIRRDKWIASAKQLQLSKYGAAR